MDTDPLTEPTFEELRQQLDNLKNVEQSREQQLQMQTEQLRERLQQATAITINTTGQIAELEANLEDQERDRHRLEGAVDVLQQMTR
jgi:predicted RNase H-like nuclease (RuvC/YqgF family)